MEIRLVETSFMEIGFREISSVEVGFGKVSLVKIGFTKIDIAEVGFAEVVCNEVWMDIWMLCSPPIPRLYPLFEYIEMCLVCHRAYLRKETFSSSSVSLYSMLDMNVENSLRTISQLSDTKRGFDAKLPF